MRRKKDIKFRPTSDFLKKAVEEYLANGGRITKLEFNENSFENFMANTSGQIGSDEFLNGG